MAVGDISRGMKRRVALRLGDVDLSGVHEDEIYAWIAQAQLEIIARQPEGSIPGLLVSQTWSSATDPPIIAGTSDYTLPTDFLWARLLTVNGISAKQLEIENISARSAQDGVLGAGSATNPYWWIWSGQFHVDAGTLALTDTLKMYYVKQAPQYLLGQNTSGTDNSAMYADTSALSETVDPVVSSLYLPAMEDYAVARGLEQRGFYGYAGALMQQFDQKLQFIAARFRTNDPMIPEGKPK